MISLGEFFTACKSSIGREPNDEQKEALKASCISPLFIVAGPGTGKTACLTLRILKLVLVDSVPPQGILATTFTKKAAAELRSRILSWGFKLIEYISADTSHSEKTRERCSNLDINQVITGTIDSICEQLLRDYRDPGTLPPVLADDFVAKTLLLREGLFDSNRYKNTFLDAFLKDLHGGGYGYNLGRKASLAQSIWDRRFHDQIDWSAFTSNGTNPDEITARNVLSGVHDAYKSSLDQRNLVDFSLLENEVLSRLSKGGMQEFRSQLSVVLVDEYQDTNLLQERIYFEFAKSCGGALTVVGDDDQSLYRFRGATVELFRDFADRYNLVFGNKPDPIFLNTNYRSTQNILNFVNNYAIVDYRYQSARVAGKPALSGGPNSVPGLPVLGLFRENLYDLAADLSRFIHQVFRDSGYVLPDGNTISSAKVGGNVGDCALLCGSPAEFKSGRKLRFPGLLRQNLRELNPAIEVFNPRGESLVEIEVVSLFGGCLLECLDPGGVVEDSIEWIGDSERAIFRLWRESAIDYLSSGLAQAGLDSYVLCWADRDPNRKGYSWPKYVPILELIYGLVHYFPLLHDDPEGQVFLEVFTRQATACEEVGKFSARVVTDPENSSLSEASVKELIINLLAPIASGAIQVNEDLMEAFPRDRLNILSIHQSKGLEFPMAIVDIGSDFTGNHVAHAFKRFPIKGGPPHLLEDLLRPYTVLGGPTRSSIDRAFDDLYRQFFVAYSRPQEVLLLVGLLKSVPDFKVSNVASGWTRDGASPWQKALPFTLI